MSSLQSQKMRPPMTKQAKTITAIRAATLNPTSFCAKEVRSFSIDSINSPPRRRLIGRYFFFSTQPREYEETLGSVKNQTGGGKRSGRELSKPTAIPLL